MKNIIAAVVLLLTSQLSLAITLDFETYELAEARNLEPYPGGPPTDYFAIYTEGFRVGVPSGTSPLAPVVLAPALVFGCDSCSSGNFFRGVDVIDAFDPSYGMQSYEVSRLDQRTFSLNSLDILVAGPLIEPELPWDPTAFTRSATFTTALDADGNIIAQRQLTTNLDSEWQYVTFDSTWSGISRLEISPSVEGVRIRSTRGVGGSIDNLNVTVVPVPAAVWLFISGLSVLGLRRRQHITSKKQ